MDELQRPRYTPEILVNALKQVPEKPLMQLVDGPMLSVGQVHDRTSQFVKVLEALAVKRVSESRCYRAICQRSFIFVMPFSWWKRFTCPCIHSVVWGITNL